MRHRTLPALLSLALTTVFLTAASAQPVKHYQPVATPIVVNGEVVDSWCYASKTVGDGRGAEHGNCARACAHGGVTLAIVDDQGTMYIAAKHKAYSGCQALLEPYVAKRVQIKGYLAKTGGCNVLKIMTVTELGPGD